MPAAIVINQETRPVGVAGRARSDGVVGQVVTCTNATPEAAYLWTLADVPIRSNLVRGTTGTGPSFSFTPDVKGTYLISLRVNNSTHEADNATSYFAIRSFGAKSLGWRYKAQGESLEDNEDYIGLGFPSNVNPRGWATDEDLVYETIEEVAWEVKNAIDSFSGTVARLVMTDPTTGKIHEDLVPEESAGSIDLQSAYDGGLSPDIVADPVRGPIKITTLMDEVDLRAVPALTLLADAPGLDPSEGLSISATGLYSEDDIEIQPDNNVLLRGDLLPYPDGDSSGTPYSLGGNHYSQRWQKLRVGPGAQNNPSISLDHDSTGISFQSTGGDMTGLSFTIGNVTKFVVGRGGDSWIATNFLPSSGSYVLGSTSRRWGHLYVAGGSSSNPPINFNNNNTGISGTSNRISFTVGGVEYARVTSDGYATSDKFTWATQPTSYVDNLGGAIGLTAANQLMFRAGVIQDGARHNVSFTHMEPATDNSYDLGRVDRRWRAVYADMFVGNFPEKTLQDAYEAGTAPEIVMDDVRGPITAIVDWDPGSGTRPPAVLTTQVNALGVGVISGASLTADGLSSSTTITIQPNIRASGVGRASQLEGGDSADNKGGNVYIAAGVGPLGDGNVVVNGAEIQALGFASITVHENDYGTTPHLSTRLQSPGGSLTEGAALDFTGLLSSRDLMVKTDDKLLVSSEDEQTYRVSDEVRLIIDDEGLKLPTAVGEQLTLQLSDSRSGFSAYATGINVFYNGIRHWYFGASRFMAVGADRDNLIQSMGVGSRLRIGGRVDRTQDARSSLYVSNYADLPFIGHNVSQQVVKIESEVAQTGTSSFAALEIDTNITSEGSAGVNQFSVKTNNARVFQIDKNGSAYTNDKLYVGALDQSATIRERLDGAFPGSSPVLVWEYSKFDQSSTVSNPFSLMADINLHVLGEASPVWVWAFRQIRLIAIDSGMNDYAGHSVVCFKELHSEETFPLNVTADFEGDTLRVWAQDVQGATLDARFAGWVDYQIITEW